MIKIERSYPAPASLASEALKTSGRYTLPDVVSQLRIDFHDKCYICEMKPLADPQVEHRLPHKNNTIPGRMFNWDNLFWACGHCNGIKNQAKYDAGILDCCKTDPEKCIEMEYQNETVSAKLTDGTNPEAKLTAELLNEVYNQRNTGIRTAACEIRLQMLQKEMGKLYNMLIRYNNEPDSRLNNIYLRELLSRESAFASIKRSYVRNNLNRFPKLEVYLR